MNTYKIRQRVPTTLISLLNRTEIKKTFSSQAQVDVFKHTLKEAVLLYKHSGVLHNGVKPYIKESKDISPQLTHLADITKIYLSHSKDIVRVKEHNARVEFFTKLLPSLFKYLHIPTQVDEVTSAHLFKLSKAISKLPNRRLYKFRNIPTDEFVKIKTDEIQLISSSNKQIKRFRTFVHYGLQTGLYTLPNTITHTT